jgi:hypothetical protein
VSTVWRPGLLLGLAAALASSAASANEERAQANLTWKGSADAAECLEAAALERAVEARLGRAVFVPLRNADLRISVALGREPSGPWSAEIDLEDSNGHRLGHRQLVIPARRCSALDDSLALAIALMVDVTRESIAPPEASPRPPPPKTTIRLPEPPVVAEPSPWRFAWFLQGRASLGRMPGWGRGLSLLTEIGPRDGWALGLGLTAWDTAQSSEQQGGKFRLQSAELDLCTTPWQASHVELGGCVGQEVSLLRAEAFGFDVNEPTQTSLVYDVTLAVRATWWFTAATGLRFGLGAAIPVMQDEFHGTLADGSTVGRLSRPPVVGLAHLGLGIRWEP